MIKSREKYQKKERYRNERKFDWTEATVTHHAQQIIDAHVPFVKKFRPVGSLPARTQKSVHRGRRCDTLQLVKQLRGGRIAVNAATNFGSSHQKAAHETGESSSFFFLLYNFEFISGSSLLDKIDGSSTRNSQETDK